MHFPPALLSGQFCPGAKPFAQPGLSRAQNITLRIGTEADPGNRTHLLWTRGGYLSADG